ncbi:MULTISPECIES: potassium channel family protein [unclassified Streptomyces]|uniref:potassium channel family protein n=1 Tax=unclassified Streptomyces TaxID=2593676 RepID=UPI002E323870|nr:MULTISPECIES: potassium channel family protein [unclassified Streptomyces]WUC63761.1 potassium channel family protein [Streptomyces sp. NBC_00539]
MTGRATTARDDRSVPGLSPGRIAWMVLRVMASVAALLALYYALPLDRTSTRFAVTILVAGLVAFVVLVGLQIRTIIRSPIPVVRAVEALALSVPFFLLLFAAAYVVLAALSPANFAGPLSHTDGLYFAVTVFATVGFGDITAKSQTARLVVTGQMVTDLIVLGLGIRLVVAAVRHRRRQQDPPRHPSDGS